MNAVPQQRFMSRSPFYSLTFAQAVFNEIMFLMQKMTACYNQEEIKILTMNVITLYHCILTLDEVRI